MDLDDLYPDCPMYHVGPPQLHTPYVKLQEYLWKQLASGLSIPAHLFSADCSYAGVAKSAATTSGPSLEEAMATAKKMIAEARAADRQLLRGWSEAIERLECPRCGRKPTLAGPGVMSATLHLCDRIYAAIKRHAGFAEREQPALLTQGVALAPFPCEPRAPLQ